MADEDTGEKSEEPTPKRKEEARKEGQVAQSAEIASAAVLFAALIVMQVAGGGMLQTLRQMASRSFSKAAHTELDFTAVKGIFSDIFRTTAAVASPILITTGIVAAAVAILQVGFRMSPKAIKPSFSKLSLTQGLKKIFSSHGLLELIKSSLKICLVGWVSFKLISASVTQIAALVTANTGEILLFAALKLTQLVVWAGAILSLLAVGDYAWQRYSHKKSLKMSKQEVKEEKKQAEGDPLIKGRFRQVHMKLTRQRMMEEVPKAHVVVTNPVHLAVALRYATGEMQAPTVVAKGAEGVAIKIRKIARRHGIPIVERRGLARALFRAVQIGQEIPADLFRAVAELLAYVYSLKPQFMSAEGAAK